MNKIKIRVLVIIMAVSATMLFAESVYLDELQTAENENDIEFLNYSGPHNKIDSIAEIRGIGEYLGRQLLQGKDSFEFYGKYSVIHAVDKNDSQGLDADIFILEEAAAVDHIINLRRIIAGYLETAYEYDLEQSDMLADFITIYNAVHRSDIEYFAVHYKKIVINNLDVRKAGLALAYSEWPGSTMMVIPLTPDKGADTELLSEDEVIDELRSREDKGIDSRQQMVELQEKEIDQQREIIEEEQNQLDEDSDKLEEQKEALEDEILQTDDQQRKEEIEEEIQKIEEEQQVIEDQKDSLREEREALGDREDKVIEERERIAEDQAEIIAEEDSAQKASENKAGDAAAEVKKVLFLKVSGSPGDYSGQLVLVDAEGASIIKSSDVDSIRLRGYKVFDDEIVSVAGSSGGNRIISLVRIDPQTLEILDSGTAEVYVDSAVVKSGGNYYAVVKDGSGWKIGIFDGKFLLESVSDAAVFPATDIVVSSSGVMAQSESGKIVIITDDDFSESSF